MLTKTDIVTIKQIIREEMKEQTKPLKEDIGLFKDQILKEIQSLRSEMVDFKREVKNDIVTFKDEIIGEIRDSQTDKELISSYKDDLEDHEVRIAKLERKPSN